MSISRSLRFQILRRDNHACRYCGRSAPDVPLTVDHVIPTALGGSDDPSNLVTACEDCNGGKAATPPDADLVADVAEDALRWAKAMQEAAAIDRQRRSDDDLFVAKFAQSVVGLVDSGLCKLDPPHLESAGGSGGFARTILRFRDCGLDMSDLTYAMQTTMEAEKVHDRNRWKYFCGICWRMIGTRQDAARALLGGAINAN